MARNFDFIKSLRDHFQADQIVPDADPPEGTLPTRTTVLVSADSQIPDYPAIRISLRREDRDDILRRPDIHNKKTALIYVEAWTAGGDPDGAVTLEALADFEEQVLASLAGWVVNPPGLDGVQFSPKVVEIVPGSDQSRPAVGSRITVKIDYL